MIKYYYFNFCVFIIAIIASVIIVKPLKKIFTNLRISFLMVFICYPWDFFAIKLDIWAYPQNPGLIIFQVPLNDLWFIFSCTLITTAVLNQN